MVMLKSLGFADDWGLDEDELELKYRKEYPEFPLGWTRDDHINKTILDKGPDRAIWFRGSLIGAGGFSKVYKVLKKRQGNLYAGKSAKDEKCLELMRKEAEVLKTLDHEHLIKLKGWYEEKEKPDNTLLLLEWFSCGDLKKHVDHAIHLRKSDVLRVVQQVGSAINWLHNRNMVHTDVKPHNILVRSFEPLDLVLSDCGSIQKMGSVRPKNAGTRMYMSPETAENKGRVSKNDDTWCLGVTMLACMGLQPKRSVAWNKYHEEVWTFGWSLLTSHRDHDLAKLLLDMLGNQKKEQASMAACCKTASRLLQGCPALADDVAPRDTMKRQERLNTLGFKGDFLAGWDMISLWE